MATSFEFQTGRVEFKSSGQGSVDSSLPTFGGIVSATPTINGSIVVTWNFGTTTKNPLRYEVYIALGSVSAATLFSTDLNVVKIVGNTVNSTVVVTLADQTTYIVNGSQYTLGVKAIDAFGYENGPASVIVVTAISSGNIGSIFSTLASQMAATEALLAQDHTNLAADHVNFQGDHTNFQNDHAAFSADHTNFQGDHLNLAADVTALNQAVADINAASLVIASLEASLQSIVNELAGSAGTALLTETIDTLLDVEILEELP